MLSDDDKAKIKAEETAKIAVLREKEAEAARVKALEQYRESVKTALTSPTSPPRSSRPRWWLLAALALLAVAAIGAILALPRASPAPDDSSGGISTSLLIERCVSAVRDKIGDLAWTFPSPEESSTQVSSNADGKRWDGWVMPRVQMEGEDQKVQFSCQYTPATDAVTTEIIKP